MRIITGTHRGRRLLSPPGEAITRPITDRAKQSLFDRLTSLGAMEAEHALDLFAGTGSLGIEALSRGVERVTFVERHRAVHGLLVRNLHDLQLTDRARVLQSDALVGDLPALLPPPPPSLIFLDPPYATASDERAQPRLIQLAQRLATPQGTLVLRTSIETPALDLTPWQRLHDDTYGSMRIVIYAIP